jgi:hypothetical protein
MASPLLFGLGAIGAALAGRMILRQRAAAAAEQWVRGGFQQKMDRKEALQILGLRYVIRASPNKILPVPHWFLLVEMERLYVTS